MLVSIKVASTTHNGSDSHQLSTLANRPVTLRLFATDRVIRFDTVILVDSSPSSKLRLCRPPPSHSSSRYYPSLGRSNTGGFYRPGFKYQLKIRLRTRYRDAAGLGSMVLVQLGRKHISAINVETGLERWRFIGYILYPAYGATRG